MKSRIVLFVSTAFLSLFFMHGFVHPDDVVTAEKNAQVVDGKIEQKDNKEVDAQFKMLVDKYHDKKYSLLIESHQKELMKSILLSKDKSFDCIKDFLSCSFVRAKIAQELVDGCKQPTSYFSTPVASYLQFIVTNLVDRLNEMMSEKARKSIIVRFFGTQNHPKYYMGHAYTEHVDTKAGKAVRKNIIDLGSGLLKILLVDGSPEDFEIRFFILFLTLAHELGHHYLGHSGADCKAEKGWTSSLANRVKNLFFMKASESRKNEAAADAFAFELLAKCTSMPLDKLQAGMDKVYEISKDIIVKIMEGIEKEVAGSSFVLRKTVEKKKEYLMQGYYAKNKKLNSFFTFLNCDPYLMPRERMDCFEEQLKNIMQSRVALQQSSVLPVNQ